MYNEADSSYLNHRKRLVDIKFKPSGIKSETHLADSYITAKKIKDENRVYNMKSIHFLLKKLERSEQLQRENLQLFINRVNFLQKRKVILFIDLFISEKRF